MKITLDNIELKSDYTIDKVVNSKGEYEDNIVEAAKRIYEERKLDSYQKRRFIKLIPGIINKIMKEAIKKGIEV